MDNLETIGSLIDEAKTELDKRELDRIRDRMDETLEKIEVRRQAEQQQKEAEEAEQQQARRDQDRVKPYIDELLRAIRRTQ